MEKVEKVEKMGVQIAPGLDVRTYYTYTVRSCFPKALLFPLDIRITIFTSDMFFEQQLDPLGGSPLDPPLTHAPISHH